MCECKKGCDWTVDLTLAAFPVPVISAHVLALSDEIIQIFAKMSSLSHEEQLKLIQDLEIEMMADMYTR